MSATRPRGVKGVVLFPGAGSAASHPSLIAIDNALAPMPVARIDFPYRRAGRRAPDRTPVLLECVREEVRAFASQLGVRTNQLVIGGRSMGGRMCSMAVADTDDPLKVAGLVLVSYPLHPPGKPEKLRTEHLGSINVPTLCVSGTKDTFGTPDELTHHLSGVPGGVTWEWMDKKGHDLKGCDDALADVVSKWIKPRAAGRSTQHPRG